MLVSIIVPVYNNSKEELKRCIHSLVQQTYTDIEVIVIDDGSEEETIQYEYKLAEMHACVRVVTQENAGVSKARNRGMEEAKGEYVCFVDADDYVESDMLHKMLARMKENNLVSIDFVHNDSDICILKPTQESILYQFDKVFIDSYLNGTVGTQIAFSSCNKMFDLSVIRKNEIYFPTDVAVGEDMIFVLNYLSKCEEIQIIPEGLYHYTIRQTSVMNAAKKDYLDLYCNTLEQLRQLCFRSTTIDDKTLGNWALEVLTYTLNNGYVSTMTYRQFKEYYKQLVQSSVFMTAIRGAKAKNLKRKTLRLVLKVRSKRLLYWLIKANQ